MIQQLGRKYFVRQLDVNEPRGLIPEEAAFEVQILNAIGEGEIVAYFGYDSNEVTMLLHTLRGRIAAENFAIPQAVIEAAKKQVAGGGEYVNEHGEVLPPFSLPWNELRLHPEGDCS